MRICNRPIGVFDSGLGGISVLRELVSILPNENYIYFGDSLYAPYGIKDKQEIIDRCIQICEFFCKKDVKTIVIACNTATSAAIEILRKKYLDIPIIGMEPALKVAAKNAKNHNIVVMATKFTLKEQRFNNLMENYSLGNNIIKMPCSELVEIVENDRINDKDLVINQLKKYYEDIDIKTLNSVVLGCTHFVFLKNYIRDILGDNINIVDGNEGTARRVRDILSIGSMLNDSLDNGNVTFFNSDEHDCYIEMSKKLFNI